MDLSTTVNIEPEYHIEKQIEGDAFVFAVIGLEHGHIYGMCQGLSEAGSVCAMVYDEDAGKVDAFLEAYPNAKKAQSKSEIYAASHVEMIACAAIPSERCGIGLEAMDAGKHFFSAKTPFTTLEQLEQAEEKVNEKNLIWAVYYSERLHVECAGFAEQLIQKGTIGDVLQVIGTGPHRLKEKTRPAWFFQKEKYGGILCDIASHQIEQYLTFAGIENAELLSSNTGNMGHPSYPELEDFGEAHLLGEDGSTGFFRVDWFTPDGLSNWGDGRTIILGTKGTIELRKYVDFPAQSTGERLYLVNQGGERRYDVKGKIGFPYFPRLIKDARDHTETAMSQQHTFTAARLCLMAQDQARVITKQMREKNDKK